MEKIKVIDLLNKIANGEMPKTIELHGELYSYHDKEHGYCRYFSDNNYICLESDYYWFDILNDEVEIIEENKKIEKIGANNYKWNYAYPIKTPQPVVDNLELIRQKINEIIDKLNKENKWN